MKKISFLYLLLLVTFSSCNDSTDSKITVISPEEMQTILQADNVQLIDVRSKEEYEKGSIAGAQNIDFFSPTFLEDINKLDKEKPVYLFCKTGGRSAKCAKKMVDEGFVKIYDLNGGFSKWKHEVKD